MSLFCNLLLSLFGTLLLGVGLAEQVKMRVALNYKEDGQTLASLLISNATSQQLSNLSLILDIDAVLDNAKKLVGARGLVREMRENGNVEFNILNEMTMIEDIKRLKSLMAGEMASKEEVVKKLQYSIDEMKRIQSSHDEDMKKVAAEMALKAKVIEELKTSFDEIKRLLSSHIEENKILQFNAEKDLYLISIGYQLIPGLGYYKYHKKGEDVLTAIKICQNEGGHLAIPNSEEEVAAIMKLYKEKNGWDVPWVGIHSPKKNKEFQTIFGTALSENGYSKWANGQPDGNEFCVLLRTNGLYDWYCEKKLDFICEHHLLKK